MATRIDRILVPLDGSVLAEAVLPVAETLARDHDAELFLVRAIEPGAASEGGGAPADADLYLMRLAQTLEKDGLRRVRPIVVRKRPATAIVEAARDQRADLIAMTTYGRTGLGRLLMGSVSDEVVRTAVAPVLLVHGRPEWRAGRTTPVLVPLDGTALGEAILPTIERLAGPLDLEIHLLHAAEPDPAGSMVLRAGEADGYLAGVAARLEEKGLRVHFAVRVGRAVEAIPSYVEEHAIGLVAMATRGRSGVGRLLLGSVAEHVLMAMTVPVVLYKAGGPESRDQGPGL